MLRKLCFTKACYFFCVQSVSSIKCEVNFSTLRLCLYVCPLPAIFVATIVRKAIAVCDVIRSPYLNMEYTFFSNINNNIFFLLSYSVYVFKLNKINKLKLNKIYLLLIKIALLYLNARNRLQFQDIWDDPFPLKTAQASLFSLFQRTIVITHHFIAVKMIKSRDLRASFNY